MGRAEDNKRDKLDRILRAGRELFEHHGYAGTTMDDVADRARVSKGALYFHVGSKAGLLNRVFGTDFTRWIDEAFSQHPDPADSNIVEQLITVYARLLGLMCATPDLTRVYMTVAGAGDDRDRASEAMQHLLGRTASLLDHAKQHGELDPAVDSRELAYNLWALYFVEQYRWLLDHPVPGSGSLSADIQARLRRPFTTQLNGYLATPSPQPRSARRGG